MSAKATGAPAIRRPVPPGPRDHCYFCRAGEHGICDDRRTTLCACHHAGHPTTEETTR